MLNETSILIVLFFLGLLMGLLAPGIIGYLNILFVRREFKSKLSLAMFAISIPLIVFMWFAGLIFFLDSWGHIIYEPLPLVIGFVIGMLGGLIALLIGFFQARKKANF